MIAGNITFTIFKTDKLDLYTLLYDCNFGNGGTFRKPESVDATLDEAIVVFNHIVTTFKISNAPRSNEVLKSIRELKVNDKMLIYKFPFLIESVN